MAIEPRYYGESDTWAETAREIGNLFEMGVIGRDEAREILFRIEKDDA